MCGHRIIERLHGRLYLCDLSVFAQNDFSFFVDVFPGLVIFLPVLIMLRNLFRLHYPGPNLRDQFGVTSLCIVIRGLAPTRHASAIFLPLPPPLHWVVVHFSNKPIFACIRRKVVSLPDGVGSEAPLLGMPPTQLSLRLYASRM